ncbi:hypothetical protein KHQ82_00030 [Mycoplasmatota bacterium]|nr:hypothetical protein KHQ82_00030 [Mycoplasmatota bacterium]
MRLISRSLPIFGALLIIALSGCTKYIDVPGETIYVDVPGETIYETVYVDVPGEIVYETIYVDVPGETIYETVYEEVPGETIYEEIEKIVEVIPDNYCSINGFEELIVFMMTEIDAATTFSNSDIYVENEVLFVYDYSNNVYVEFDVDYYMNQRIGETSFCYSD